ncbi:hypothetical protein BOX15_Mlig022575g1, partial [Macrostomum lignano]|uniref:Fibronectin type-III domain-containing protein n=2 Tax=Macrostomum lignano TaxID=282301 RepID=A0A1I8I795_9PLAT
QATISASKCRSWPQRCSEIRSAISPPPMTLRSCLVALAAFISACSFPCCCPAEQTLPLHAKVLQNGSDQLLHLFWQCDNSSDCGQPEVAKICFEDMWRKQDGNGTVVEMKQLLMPDGQRYRYALLRLSAKLLFCSRAYRILLEFGASSSNTELYRTKSLLNCSESAWRSAGYIRIPRQQALCTNGDRQIGSAMDADLPADIHRFLLQQLAKPEVVRSHSWVGLVAGTAATFLVAACAILIAWALLTGRLEPSVESLVAQQHWEPVDLEIRDPDHIDRKLLVRGTGPMASAP